MRRRWALCSPRPLSDEGHRVIGPIESRTEALTVVEQARPDVAILDIMLRDGSCGPVISELRDRGIPFMIFSGRGRGEAAIDKLDDVPWVKKPGRLHELAAALNSLTPISRQHEVVPEPLVESSRPSVPAFYPDDLEPALQQGLAALADIEFRYERLAERLDGSSRPQVLKDRLAQKLEARHQKEREPHVQRLPGTHQPVFSKKLGARHKKGGEPHAQRLAELHQRMFSVRLVARRSVH